LCVGGGWGVERVGSCVEGGGGVFFCFFGGGGGGGGPTP